MKRYLDAAVSTLKALPLYRKRLKILRKDCAGYELYNFPLYQTGAHPSDYQYIECTFAANNLLDVNGGDILDVGSYRRFVIGLAASYKLTTVDIRPRAFGKQYITHPVQQRHGLLVQGVDKPRAFPQTAPSPSTWR